MRLIALTLATAAVAAVAAAGHGSAGTAGTGDTLPPTAVKRFTGWISGANMILHWVPADDQGGGRVAQYGLYRDGALLKTLSGGTKEWLIPVSASRGHGYQVRAIDDSGNAGPLSYDRLSPLPKLRGLKLPAANLALRRAGFVPGTVLFHRCDGPRNVVLDLRSRGVVPLGWQVGFLVSR